MYGIYGIYGMYDMHPCSNLTHVFSYTGKGIYHKNNKYA